MVGVEPANLGNEGQNATSRPQKPHGLLGLPEPTVLEPPKLGAKIRTTIKKSLITAAASSEE